MNEYNIEIVVRGDFEEESCEIEYKGKLTAQQIINKLSKVLK